MFPQPGPAGPHEIPVTRQKQGYCDAKLKRLELGTFEVPKPAMAVREDGSPSSAGIEMRLSDLTLILEGIDLASVRRRPRWRRA
jgi:hypothetical protein